MSNSNSIPFVSILILKFTHLHCVFFFKKKSFITFHFCIFLNIPNLFELDYVGYYSSMWFRINDSLNWIQIFFFTHFLKNVEFLLLFKQDQFFYVRKSLGSLFFTHLSWIPLHNFGCSRFFSFAIFWRKKGTNLFLSHLLHDAIN